MTWSLQCRDVVGRIEARAFYDRAIAGEEGAEGDVTSSWWRLQWSHVRPHYLPAPVMPCGVVVCVRCCPDFNRGCVDAEEVHRRFSAGQGEACRVRETPVIVC